MQKVSKQRVNFLTKLIMGVFIITCLYMLPNSDWFKPAPAQAATIKTVTVAAGTQYATPLYIIESGVPGPVVMIVGGVHGNETAGYLAAEKLTKLSINKGTLLVLPRANKLADAAHTRTINGYDLNRKFPSTASGAASGTLAQAIFSVMKSYKIDWLMDMHEGANYEKIKSSSSVGQSLIYYPDDDTKKVADSIVKTLNSGIATSYKEFSLLRYPVSGSLARCAAVSCGANSFIFETCSKDPLSTRINYQIKAANMLLSKLDMK